MTVAQVNYLNIALILLSAALAFLLPFELFLFSYAILGPLHYLTEIGWLHKKDYFTSGKRDYYFLIGLCLVSLIAFLADKLTGNPTFAQTAWAPAASGHLRTWVLNFIIMAFVAALAMVLFKKTNDKVIFTLICTGLLLLIAQLRPYLIILAVLLPTIIHVSLFMVAFILFGALKGKSLSGYLTVAVFIVCGASFFFINVFPHYQVHTYFWQQFIQADFMSLNKILVRPEVADTPENFLLSPLGLEVQRFIAFTYTYHYLNWFSKTKVIDWHNVSASWRWFTLIAWIASVALYLIDFKTGLTALFFLSMLHVFLEFPLNYRSFIGIGKILASKNHSGTADY